jgi:hypothetical protein
LLRGSAVNWERADFCSSCRASCEDEAEPAVTFMPQILEETSCPVAGFIIGEMPLVLVLPFL